MPITMVLSRKERRKAESIRKQEISRGNQLAGLCHPPPAEDARYNIRAYEMMTAEQILSSQKRFYQQMLKDCSQPLRDYQESQQQARINMKKDDRYAYCRLLT
jgi:hypothetical protein